MGCVALDKSLNLSETVSPSLTGQKGAVITSLQCGFEDQKRNSVCERLTDPLLEIRPREGREDPQGGTANLRRYLQGRA